MLLIPLGRALPGKEAVILTQGEAALSRGQRLTMGKG